MKQIQKFLRTICSYNENLPKLFQLTCSALRIDQIITKTFGYSRKEIEESFYDGNISLNGKNISKKSLKVNVEDIIEIMLEKNEEFEKKGRLIILDVLKNQNKKSYEISIVRWKILNKKK
ncbi:hypothetical protein SNEBB_001526 [Seison nebaliae]|nr:hypothetical protein SNEBB_001526 [Seison nebaliae]